MSTEETRAKSFAGISILVAIAIAVCIVFWAWGVVFHKENVPVLENKTWSFEQVDKKLAVADKKDDAVEKLTKDVKEEIRKFEDEVKQFKKEIEELEHLMCEKGLLKNCKSI